MLIVCAVLVGVIVFVDAELRKRRALRAVIEDYKRSSRRGR